MIKIQKISIALVLYIIWQAHAQSNNIYLVPHELMVEAIDQGVSSGRMGGELAKLFAQQFSSSGSLQVSARSIRDFKDPECKRLEVIFTQEGVPTPKGVTEAVLKTELNYCKNGMPPLVME